MAKEPYKPVIGDKPPHGPGCDCTLCLGLLAEARKYVNANLLKAKPEASLIPFIMHLRELEKRATPMGLAGRPEIVDQYYDSSSPWGDNATRDLEDSR